MIMQDNKGKLLFLEKGAPLIAATDKGVRQISHCQLFSLTHLIMVIMMMIVMMIMMMVKNTMFIFPDVGELIEFPISLGI